MSDRSECIKSPWFILERTEIAIKWGKEFPIDFTSWNTCRYNSQRNRKITRRRGRKKSKGGKKKLVRFNVFQSIELLLNPNGLRSLGCFLEMYKPFNVSMYVLLWPQIYVRKVNFLIRELRLAHKLWIFIHSKCIVRFNLKNQKTVHFRYYEKRSSQNR